ncbi:MAG TPA: hemerythrin domain-containing protein [Streptosporangiaceae bacterium]|nr:hemerythrin domain-containing protein [Streptosporangiaceae bacterium]
MTTDKLPGTDAAKHGAGDADLTIMYAAHDAFRRDLTSLARATAGKAGKASNLSDPAKQASVAAGWEVFKRQLHMHHTSEDSCVWPVLRTRFATSESALSVLDAMEEEHQQIDPLLAAVDDAFARRRGDGPDSDDWPGIDRLADVVDVLTTSLTGHLQHEEREGLPLVSAGLTNAQWRGVGRQMARQNGLSAGSEMFAWMLSGASPDNVKRTLGQLPAPLRVIYRAVWKPRFAKTARWLAMVPAVGMTCGDGDHGG